MPRPDHSAVNFNLVPTVGEYFVFPALTTTGPYDIMVFEGVIGGPMDRWKDVKTRAEHLAKSKWILDTFLLWEAERCRSIELIDDNGILSGAFPPTVRKPVARLPSGALVLGMADVVCLNDPITGQGSNNASKAAKANMDAILAQGDQRFDAAFMQRAFDNFWSEAQYATAGPTRCCSRRRHMCSRSSAEHNSSPAWPTELPTASIVRSIFFLGSPSPTRPKRFSRSTGMRPRTRVSEMRPALRAHMGFRDGCQIYSRCSPMRQAAPRNTLKVFKAELSARRAVPSKA